MRVDDHAGERTLRAEVQSNARGEFMINRIEERR